MRPIPDRRTLTSRGITWIREAALVIVGLPVVTVVSAAVLSVVVDAAPLTSIKRALFIVGWLAVGLASLTAWQRARPNQQPPGARTREHDYTAEPLGYLKKAGRQPARGTRLLVAGGIALLASVLLEVGLDVGG